MPVLPVHCSREASLTWALISFGLWSSCSPASFIWYSSVAYSRFIDCKYHPFSIQSKKTVFEKITGTQNLGRQFFTWLSKFTRWLHVHKSALSSRPFLSIHMDAVHLMVSELELLLLWFQGVWRFSEMWARNYVDIASVMELQNLETGNEMPHRLLISRVSAKFSWSWKHCVNCSLWVTTGGLELWRRLWLPLWLEFRPAPRWNWARLFTSSRCRRASQVLEELGVVGDRSLWLPLRLRRRIRPQARPFPLRVTYWFRSVTNFRDVKISGSGIHFPFVIIVPNDLLQFRSATEVAEFWYSISFGDCLALENWKVEIRCAGTNFAPLHAEGGPASRSDTV